MTSRFDSFSRRRVLAGALGSLSAISIGTGSAIFSTEPLPEDQPTVIGHRGAAGLAPPNTEAAIRKAIKFDADGVELDVRQTHDRELVLFHDPLLNLKTNGHGIVHESPSESVLDAEINGHDILTLDDGLEIVRNSDLELYLELKRPGYAAEVISRVVEYGLVQQTTIVSFETEALKTAINSEVNIDVGLLGSAPSPTLVKNAENLGVDVVLAHYVPRATSLFIKEAKKSEVTGGIWSLIDTEHSIRDAIESNPEIITTNRPDIVLDLLSKS